MASDSFHVRIVLIALAAAFMLLELFGWLPPITADYLPAPR